MAIALPAIMSAVILPFRIRFDPLDPAAEAHYDRVVFRLNRRMTRQRQSVGLADEIERQFAENDLVVAGGSRRGQPLTIEGRRRRLAQLLSLRAEQRCLKDQIEQLEAELDSMNEQLDAWARDTYGLRR